MQAVLAISDSQPKSWAAVWPNIINIYVANDQLVDMGLDVRKRSAKLVLLPSIILIRKSASHVSSKPVPELTAYSSFARRRSLEK